MSEMPIDFNGLDTAVHGPIRLGVLTALQMNGPLDFTTLKKQLQVSDGTLGMHLQKLEEVGYLGANTVLIGRRPKTTYRLTVAGRKALASYLDSMRLLMDAIEARRTENQSRTEKK
ncbi:MAG TPA: transcriptional regulator [Gemmataceae bacterium]|jgi:DNA-binding MarR family transcriptional regulator